MYGLVKYACKVASSQCLSQSFTAVHEDVPKCMPEESLLLMSLFSSDFAGSNPAVRQKRIASGLDLSFGTQEDSTRRESFRVTETRFVIIRQREKCPGISLGAMQKRALPESGYRVIPIGAKRFLSAPCRKHSNFQPLLLHE